MLIRQLMGAQAREALSHAKDFVLRAIDQVTFKTRDLVGAEHSPSTMRWVPEPDTTASEAERLSSPPQVH
jgi:hypothetical protein